MAAAALMALFLTFAGAPTIEISEVFGFRVVKNEHKHIQTSDIELLAAAVAGALASEDPQTYDAHIVTLLFMESAPEIEFVRGPFECPPNFSDAKLCWGTYSHKTDKIVIGIPAKRNMPGECLANSALAHELAHLAAAYLDPDHHPETGLHDKRIFGPGGAVTMGNLAFCIAKCPSICGQ
jgi:hypothetical protein